ncbi:MAG TPA: ABC transporter ATP-binding protein [Planctomycetaceae bacterium]|nr:ABC transporter ATP-binding protein [Planctomycetaceae bacterium]
MIRVVNVTQHYGIKPVLKQISLEIPASSRTAVIGPNGMGKTTFLSVLAGVLQPQSGYVEIEGLRRRSSVENERTIRKRAVFLPDRCFLPKNRTGREFLLGVGQMYELDRERIVHHAESLLKLFDLAALADSPIRTYSAGQMKKISLCSALITDAHVLLLDEPFSGGLDPAGILALKHVLRRLSLERGRTVVLTSPVPELVVEVADRLIVIEKGRVSINGTLEELKRETGHTGSMNQMLHEVIFPETLVNIDAYFAEEDNLAGGSL